MNKLHNKVEYSQEKKPEGGSQATLCSNDVLPCATPSGFIINNFVSEDDALDYLAEVLVETFLDHKKYHANKTTQGSRIVCPSINKRTS